MKRKQTRKDSPPKRRRRQQETIADWESGDARLLQRLIGAIAKDDGAVRFGYSRDGGAYAVGIYGDGEAFTEYLPGNGDVDEWVTELIEDYS